MNVLLLFYLIMYGVSILSFWVWAMIEASKERDVEASIMCMIAHAGIGIVLCLFWPFALLGAVAYYWAKKVEKRKGEKNDENTD